MSLLEGTEVIDRLTIQQLVDEYRVAERDILSGFAKVHAGLQRITTAFAPPSYTSMFDLRGRRNDHGLDWGNPGPAIAELRRQIWRCLIERSQVRKAMSIKAWDDLDKEINHGVPPEVTVEIMQGMLDRFRADIPAMLEAAVHEVFDWLRPRCSKYKTNSEFEIGERVILGWMVEHNPHRGWHVRYGCEQNLVALENVFTMLDGKVRSDSDTYYSDLSRAIAASPSCHGETDYFAFKGYVNMNLHLRFRRMDLVRRLNAVAGGARLKPPAPTGQDAHP